MSLWYRGFLIVVAVVALAISQTASKNPCDGQDLVFVNDYTSCSNYFSCLKGVAFPKKCPDGRWFSKNPLGCHLPQTVDCEICPSEGVINVGVPESCTEYILCINGNALERTCAPGTRFDRTEGRCNLEELVPCEFLRCQVTGTGIEADPTSCRHYLVCVDGEKIVRRECNENLLFDSILGSCALPENVDCASRPRENMRIPSAPLVNLPVRFSENIGELYVL
jgi:Chitin binding Peritrophin-A domain